MSWARDVARHVTQTEDRSQFLAMVLFPRKKQRSLLSNVEKPVVVATGAAQAVNQ